MLIEKVLKNCCFFLPAFGRILVLVAAFFLLHCPLKRIETLIFFPAFGKILVLVAELRVVMWILAHMEVPNCQA